MTGAQLWEHILSLYPRFLQLHHGVELITSLTNDWIDLDWAYLSLQMLYSLSSLSDCAVVAVNQEYVEKDQTIHIKEGDEVAIIPPISGGWLRDKLEGKLFISGLSHRVSNCISVGACVAQFDTLAIAFTIHTTRWLAVKMT